MSDAITGTQERPDLAACDTEPIHVPGSVQPHGVLLAVTEPDHVVEVVSGNVEELLRRPATSVLGGTLGDVLGAAAAQRVTDAASAGRLAERSLVPVVLPGAVQPEWDATLFRSGDLLVVELEPTAGRVAFGDLYAGLRGAMVRLQSAASVTALAEAAAHEVRRITGFDRVMVYRFAEDLHGEVIAEDVRADWEPYLGLHYPASDIPAQARRLYERNWIRTIATASYTPVPLLGHGDRDGVALDLSDSVLRSVSPVHLEYLANMGVTASMSVSLLHEGRLWGLIACHHGRPRRLTSDERSSCELVGITLSQQLAAMEARDEALADAEAERLVAELLRRVTSSEDVAGSLVAFEPRMSQLVASDGAAVCLGGRVRSVGTVPADVTSVVTAMPAAAAGQAVATDHVAGLPGGPDAAPTCGALVVPLARGGQDYLAWFRQEVVRTVGWAGEPEKAVVTSTSGNRLAPRGSFALWLETVRDRSAPWSPQDRRAAEALARMVTEVVLRRTSQITSLNNELQRSNDELDAFAHLAAHDLKEPLRGIANYTTFVLEDHAEGLGPEGTRRLETVRRLAERMDDLLDSLLHFSRVGQLELAHQEVDLDRVLDDVLESLALRVEESGIVVRRHPLPSTHADALRLGEVLQNLVANAIKYTPGPGGVLEIGSRRVVPPGREVSEQGIYVRDSGIGIPPERQDDVFALFRRLHGAQQYGGGTGAGLSISRRIVERHGGAIWVESAAGEGSTFWFTVPEPARPGAPAEPGPSGQSA